MKDEYNSTILGADGTEKERAKEVPTRTTTRMRHQTYVDVLTGEQTTTVEAIRIVSSSLQVYTMATNKKALSPYDDKRYVLADRITKLAFDHCMLMWRRAARRHQQHKKGVYVDDKDIRYREMTAEFVRHVLNKNFNGCHSTTAWISLTDLHHHRLEFARIVDLLPEPPSSAYEYVVRRLLLLDNAHTVTWHKIVVLLAFATYVQERFDGCSLDRATVALVEQCLQDWVALTHWKQLQRETSADCNDWSTHCTNVLANCCAIELDHVSKEEEAYPVTANDSCNDNDGNCARSSDTSSHDAVCCNAAELCTGCNQQ
jgi:hypothetical protein